MQTRGVILLLFIFLGTTVSGTRLSLYETVGQSCTLRDRSVFMVQPATCYCATSFTAAPGIGKLSRNTARGLERFPWASVPCAEGKCELVNGCDENEIPIFMQRSGGITEGYMCECKYGFYRVKQNAPCRQCLYNFVCPAYSDFSFSCPPNTVIATPESALEAHDPQTFVYCRTNDKTQSLYVVADYATQYTILARSNGEMLYDVSASKLSVYKVDGQPASTCTHSKMQNVARVDGSMTCVCKRAYYFSETELSCKICPRGSFCADERINACPFGSETLYTGASSASECMCKESFYLHGGECMKSDSVDGVAFFSQGRELPHRLKCPIGRACVNGFLLSCAEWEYEASDVGCVVCPVGFYCRDGSAHRCPHHATTATNSQVSASACFCVPGFKPVLRDGVSGGFVCVSMSTQDTQTSLSVLRVEKFVDMHAHKKWALWQHIDPGPTDTIAAVASIDTVQSMFDIVKFYRGTERAVEVRANTSAHIPLYISNNIADSVIDSFTSTDGGVVFHLMIRSSANNVELYTLRSGAAGDYSWGVTAMGRAATHKMISVSHSMVPLLHLLVETPQQASIKCYSFDGAVYRVNMLQDSVPSEGAVRVSEVVLAARNASFAVDVDR